MKHMTLSDTAAARLRVAGVVLGITALIALLWVALLAPMNRERHRLINDITTLRTQLAIKDFLMSHELLEAEKRKEQIYQNRMQAEWIETVDRVSGFPQDSRLPGISSAGQIIDYKVALFEVKQRLLRKANALSISLPQDLGMDTAVHSDEDARRRMLQLRAVETAVDMALDLKIHTVHSVEPVVSIGHTLPDTDELYLEEYPVTLRFFGTLENLYACLEAILQPESFFILRQLRMETTSEKQPGLLNITLTLSRLLFIKSPAEVALPASALKPQRITPRGH